MSTENNNNELYNNSIKILSDLISFKTISGEDNNSLINYCDDILKKVGATSFKTFDDEKVTVLGQLVHNPIVDEELKDNGVQHAELHEPVNRVKGTVIITAHGASNKDKEAWRSEDRKIIDTTCPLVHKAHQALEELVVSGYFPVVIGKKEHVEVKGLIGDFPEALVVESETDISNIPNITEPSIVAARNDVDY